MSTVCSKYLLASLMAVLLRWCVGYFGYSGAGKSPMFGDYEAQRHWQEVAVNLPMEKWYTNVSRSDLVYRGLGYPPLMAYHSLIVSHLAQIINHDGVALNTSRRYGSYKYKLYMRCTVLVADLFVYFPAVLWMSSTRKAYAKDNGSEVKGFFLMLMYPGLILIDYGRFQYNCISLGLALAALASLANAQNVFGTVLFCLAVNYKQAELYHAVSFFCFVLGSSLERFRYGGILDLIKIGLAVTATFAACWVPFLHSIDSVKQVVHRLFPFARGLSEDKVSNVWCILSFVKWEQLLTHASVWFMCFCSTAVCLLPSSLDLLFRPTFKSFRYALVNSSLAPFLFSFQAHETDILISALSVCLLIPDHPLWCFWFLQISSFSMLPLLIKDGLLVPYFSLMCLCAILYYNFYPVENTDNNNKSDNTDWINLSVKIALCMSTVGVVILTLVTVLVPPPEHLPDLFSLVVSVYSCGHFLLFTLFFHYCQLSGGLLSLTSKYMEKMEMHSKSDSNTKTKSNISKERIDKITRTKSNSKTL